LAKIAEFFKVPLEELRKFDYRGSLADLKRLIEKDPNLGFAFRTAIDEVNQGKVTTEELAKKLSESGG